MKLVESAKEIEIKPIQLLIKEILVKILKNKNVTAKILFKYKEVYYYLSFEEGMFNHGFIEEKKSLILNRILSSSEGGDIYVDEDTIDVIPSENKINLLKLNVGELINEKIFKKQVFHSRRFL